MIGHFAKNDHLFQADVAKPDQEPKQQRERFWTLPPNCRVVVPCVVVVQPTVIIEHLPGVAIGDGESLRIVLKPLLSEGAILKVLDLGAGAVGQDVGRAEVVTVVVVEHRTERDGLDIGRRDRKEQRDDQQDRDQLHPPRVGLEGQATDAFFGAKADAETTEIPRPAFAKASAGKQARDDSLRTTATAPHRRAEDAHQRDQRGRQSVASTSAEARDFRWSEKVYKRASRKAHQKSMIALIMRAL